MDPRAGNSEEGDPAREFFLDGSPYCSIRPADLAPGRGLRRVLVVVVVVCVSFSAQDDELPVLRRCRGRIYVIFRQGILCAKKRRVCETICAAIVALAAVFREWSSKQAQQYSQPFRRRLCKEVNAKCDVEKGRT
jgi:hypothetical protein